ncbi:MAG TPA: hypothetical protein VF846_19890, partial [Thermoanaerobaculia bacterium]
APLLEREAYRAYLQYLAEREAAEPSEAVRRALATEQVKISIERRVVIPRTTLLVLETEWDYQRFGIDRRALADILTIDAGGITRVDRTAAAPPRPIPVAVAPPPIRRRETAPEPPIVPQSSQAEFEKSTVDAMPLSRDMQQEVALESAAAAPPAVNEAIAVGAVADAPATEELRASTPMPRPRERRPNPRPSSKSRDPKWTTRVKPSRADIARLEKELADDPRNRITYNDLGEALAALDEWTAVRALALRWQPFDPENPQVYELLGMAADARGDDTEAARAFASLIEVAPAKTELLQRAGLLLLRANRARLAEASLRKALEARPDRANGYRHLALMLWQSGRVEEAARVLESATRQQFPAWYRDVQRVIREELGYVYRAWQKKEPARRNEIAERAREHNVDLERTDALRVTLVWETDANDVDLHVVDPAGEECYYEHRETRSGLQLYEDITEGLGPEVIRTAKTQPGTYHVGVRYFAAGPMGISRGVVVVMSGDERIEVHPFRLVEGGGDIRYVAGVRVK